MQLAAVFSTRLLRVTRFQQIYRSEDSHPKCFLQPSMVLNQPC